jgi:hypothetical protein
MLQGIWVLGSKKKGGIMRHYSEDSRFDPPVDEYDFRGSRVGPTEMSLLISDREHINQKAYEDFLKKRGENGE